MLCRECCNVNVFLFRRPPLFGRQLVEQFKAHVHAYAEILHRWKMDHQRLELLKAVGKSMSLKKEVEGHGISKYLIRSVSRWNRAIYYCFADVAKVCNVCLTTTDRNGCPVCGSRIGALLCSVCRLPVKGARTLLLL